MATDTTVARRKPPYTAGGTINAAIVGFGKDVFRPCRFDSVLPGLVMTRIATRCCVVRLCALDPFA
jgi:hypothetical protein